MHKLTSASLFFLAAGILTSVTILSGFQVLFTVAVFYYMFQAYKDKDLKLPVSAYWLLAFAVVALISTIINIELIPKPSKNFGRIKYFLYGVCGIYVFRYWLKEANDKIKKIISNTFLLSVVVGGLYTIIYYLVTDDARGRPLTETMRYGYGSAMLLLTLLSIYLHKEKFKNWIQPKFLLAAILIGFLGMFLTYTRGGFLAFLCGLPFALYFHKKKMVLIGLGISLIIMGTMGTFYLFGSKTNVNFRMLSTKGFGSDDIRMSQWQSAIYAIKEKPILGWGLSNFHTQLKRIKDTYDLGAKNYIDAHSHNVFLEIGAGTGLIGLFLFLGWLITWAIESFKAGGMTRALVVPFGVAFVVGAQFEVTLDANNASMIFALYSLSAAIYSKAKSI
jgi:O-antigen ligase